MVLCIFGIGVNCQVVLSNNPLVSAFPAGVCFCLKYYCRVLVIITLKFLELDVLKSWMGYRYVNKHCVKCSPCLIGVQVWPSGHGFPVVT